MIHVKGQLSIRQTTSDYGIYSNDPVRKTMMCSYLVKQGQKEILEGGRRTGTQGWKEKEIKVKSV